MIPISAESDLWPRRYPCNVSGRLALHSVFGLHLGCHPQLAVSGGPSISAHLPLRVWVKAVNVISLCQSLRRLNDTTACYLLSQQFTALLQFECSLFAVCLQNVRFRASYALYLHFTCFVSMVTLNMKRKWVVRLRIDMSIHPTRTINPFICHPQSSRVFCSLFLLSLFSLSSPVPLHFYAVWRQASLTLVCFKALGDSLNNDLTLNLNWCGAFLLLILFSFVFFR